MKLLKGEFTCVKVACIGTMDAAGNEDYVHAFVSRTCNVRPQ
ncbi:hypothetical protein SF83666_a42290 (plasmid) [Sinorhizobium fredii CCBAU 83666]|nr:hypothetical protein SF83666_a42290 [Sinorhizobium fredii CCBAU 83666]